MFRYSVLPWLLWAIPIHKAAHCQLLHREKTQPTSKASGASKLSWSHLSWDATKQVHFSLRRPLASKRLWSNLWDMSNCLWLKSKSHFTFLVLYVSNCSFKANKYCLCFCDRHCSAHTSQHSWCDFCDYFSAGTSCHICSQTETQKEISFHLSTAVCKWFPFFHHFPLMSFIISKSFICLVLFLSSPWGSPVFLFSFNPFTVFTASTLHTAAPVCPWDLHCLTGLWLPSCIPVVAFRWGQSPLASTAAPQLCSVAHCFVQQLLGLQSLNFLYPTDPVLQNSPNLQKPHGWSRMEMWWFGFCCFFFLLMWHQKPQIQLNLTDIVYSAARKIPKCTCRQSISDGRSLTRHCVYSLHSSCSTLLSSDLHASQNFSV